ncbi:hypothetical protein [Paraglaciecola sp. 2405UD69-4]|uniref:hypothetical protein n=1 Tax=Paraglaciecola sp. 2405UD69-4 TaxID=3391836 RepID=UPI0039C90681
MICKGCGEEKELIDAHIIPKWVYMNLRSDSNHLNLILSSEHNKNSRISRSNKGDYDKTILCKECDSVFEKWDGFAKRLLVDEFNNFKEIRDNGELLAWDMGKIDHRSLVYFFLSILWRSSISHRPFSRGVQLGTHEKIIKSILWERKLDNYPCYSVVLFKFYQDKDNTIEKTIFSPELVKYDGINHYHLYLAGYKAIIKIDRNRKNPNFSKFEIKENNCLILAKPFGQSKEENYLKSCKNRYQKHTK